MLDQVFDTFRKASESTVQMQQELFKQWTSQWPVPGASGLTSPVPGAASATAWAEQVQSLQKKWLDQVTNTLNKHRETLDTQYKAGIRAIEDAFHVTEAKTPEEYRKMTEDLWRKSFETLKTNAETQVRDLQAAFEKWMELVGKAKV